MATTQEHETIQHDSVDTTTPMATTTEDYGTKLHGSIDTTASTVDEDMPVLDQDSAIAELQAALGPLLLIKRDKSSIPKAITAGYETPPEEPFEWTGTFRLLDLPRELRDKIYRYILQRPDRTYYTAHVNQPFWWNWRIRSEDISNLFLVSKQVHQEALDMFCRCNVVILSTPYGSDREGLAKPLRGQLRLFPERIARRLTKVRITYNDIVDRPYGPHGDAPSHASVAMGGDGTERYRKNNRSEETFHEILSDAHVLQEFFPNLQVFEVAWRPRADGALTQKAEAMKYDTDTKREENLGTWLRLMREWLKDGKVAPLGCVTFFLDGPEWNGYGERLDGLINEAYQIIVKEWKGPEVDIEDSGRLWLEEMDKEQVTRKGKKRGNKAKQCA